MIKAIQISSLLEEYETAFKSKQTGHYCEIFVNSSFSELKSLGHLVRFAAFKDTKTVYAWDADYGLHQEVIKHLGLRGRNCIGFEEPLCENLLMGIAEQRGSRYHMAESVTIDQYVHDDSIGPSYKHHPDIKKLLEILDDDWFWVENKSAIDVFDFLGDRRDYLAWKLELDSEDED